MRTFLHATFSPSDKSWLNYDREKIRQRVMVARAVQRGTELHELAEHCIRIKTPLDNSNGVIATYVRDCIDFDMSTEHTLTYSEDIGGTADAIRFDDYNNRLYVFDLKTGDRKTSIDQVVIYAALWCLLHYVNPLSITFDLRVYSRSHPQRLVSGDEQDEMLVSQRVYDAAESIKYVQSVIDEAIAEGL